MMAAAVARGGPDVVDEVIEMLEALRDEWAEPEPANGRAASGVTFDEIAELTHEQMAQAIVKSVRAVPPQPRGGKANAASSDAPATAAFRRFKANRRPTAFRWARTAGGTIWHAVEQDGDRSLCGLLRFSGDPPFEFDGDGAPDIRRRCPRCERIRKNGPTRSRDDERARGLKR